MVLVSATPKTEIDSETFDVPGDGERLVCEPTDTQPHSISANRITSDVQSSGITGLV